MTTYRALVVDDATAVRLLTKRALTREDIACDTAADGVEATVLLGERQYDVVVTDLSMPNQHGCSLAVDLLKQADHPPVVIVSGVLEPRLTRDLYARGVDDVVFKPVDYDVFAAKIKSLVMRRAPHPVPAADFGQRSTVNDIVRGAAPNGAHRAFSPVTLPTVEKKLSHLAEILPMSKAALDVVELVRDAPCCARQITAAIARDASFAVEVLKLANSSFYNSTGQKIAELEQAVTRIGLRRVGELAIATTALTALTTGVLPWLDVGLAWRRSIAAGLAVDSLTEKAGLADDHDGLFLCARMHGLGRIALGTLFPNEYSAMINTCRESNQPLLSQEAEVFPESHPEIMVRLLQMWRLPAEICEPLKYLAAPYSALPGLDELLRKKVAMLKISVLLGRLAVGQWEPWDRVEFPSCDVTRALKVDSIAAAVEQTKEDLFKVIHFRKHPTINKPQPRERKKKESDDRQLNYCTIAPDGCDFLSHLFRAMNIQSHRCEIAELASNEDVLINGIGTPAHRLAAYLDDQPECDHRMIVTDPRNADSYRQFAQVIVVPCSFAALQTACHKLSRELKNKSTSVSVAARIYMDPRSTRIASAYDGFA